MRKLFKGLYKILDKLIITPISRLVYNIQNLFKRNGNFMEKVLNRKTFLIYLSLIFAVIFFLLVDSKVINLVSNNAEIIRNVPVEVKYNEEAYVVEGVPETVDITISGRKSDIYLARQLGEFKVNLDLTKYGASDSARKVYFTYAKNVDNLTYKLDPSYVSVLIKNKVSSVSSVNYELINQDKLDPKLSVKSVQLDKSEVVVKASQSTIDKIAMVKGLIDLNNSELTEAGTYDLDNVKLVAYDSAGKIIKNVEMVPKKLSATVVLDSYSTSIPIEVKTTGKLVAGKSVASVQINNESNFAVTVYGNEEELSKISSIPVHINIDGKGANNAENFKVTLSKPAGVRSMSTNTVNLSLTFGDETQKTIDITNINPTNLGANLKANTVSNANISVICKGVSSVVEKINAEDINAYVDLKGLGVGDHEVEVKISDTNPMVNYVVSQKITIRISEE